MTGLTAAGGPPRTTRGAIAAQDFHPSVDLRSPEYVQAACGEEWWIPDPDLEPGRR